MDLGQCTSRRSFLVALAIAATVSKMPAMVSGPPHTVRVILAGDRDGVPFQEVAEVTRDTWLEFVEARGRWLGEYSTGRLTNLRLTIDHPYSGITTTP